MTVASESTPSVPARTIPSTVTWIDRPGPAPPFVPDDGRYALLSRLGQGGVGEVHAAWDRVLERRVALKWLRPERASAGAEVRLLREAQALARLAHPHVVAVHDVGFTDGRVFLAMEYVAGPTLGEWLAAGPRPWRQVVGLFRDAGRGLAAVHRAGLVHRDFKPSNVLIASPGDRALVTDLGLACAAGLGETETPPSTASPGALGERLTATGAVLGTPAYMAPEQRRGQSADARSDQYSFAVALWEALAGERPEAELTRRGARRGGPRRLPSGLEPVLRRALAAEPADRHPSMEALLGELDRALGRRRKRVLGAAVVAASGFVLVLGAHAIERRAALCAGGGARWQALFGPAEQAALRSAFAASGAPGAGALSESVAARLEAWGAEWADGHREACTATRIAGEQSDALLDRRMVCLDRRLRETGALVNLLTHADAAVVTHALESVNDLPALGPCADLPALLALLAPPADPLVAARVETVAGELAAARALIRVGRYDDARASAAQVATAARGTGWTPLVAEAEANLAEAQSRAGDFASAVLAYQRVIPAAVAGGEDRVLAESAASLAWMLAESGRFDEAHRSLDLADAVLIRLGEPLAMASRFANYRGEILRRQGRYPEAIAAHRRAVALDRRQGAEAEPWDRAVNLNNLGGALAGAGENHEAIAVVEESLALKRQVLAPDHPSLAATIDNLGTLWRNAGSPERSLPLFEEARGIRQQKLTADHPDRLGGEVNYGAALTALGRPKEGLAVIDAALPELERVSPGRPALGYAWLHRGRALAALGRSREARASFASGLALFEGALGPDHPILASPLLGLAEIELDRGRPRSARAFGERALARLGGAAAPGPQPLRGLILFALARSLGHSDHADALAHEALERLAGDSPHLADRRRAVTDWLAGRSDQ